MATVTIPVAPVHIAPPTKDSLSVGDAKQKSDDGIRCISSTSDIHIEQVSVLSVQEGDRVRFNTNNHWPENVKPSDTEEVSARGNTDRWVDQFYSHYQVLNIHPQEVLWMYRAWLIGRTTGKFPEQFKDELSDYISSQSHASNDLLKVGCFVRTQSVSLKTGMHGVGPYRTLQQVVESIVTSRSGHSPLDHYQPIKISSISSDTKDTKETTTKERSENSGKHQQQALKLFLLPWIEMNGNMEFRAFVYKNRVTAISQQNLYIQNPILNALPNDNERVSCLSKWCNTIVSYHRDVLINALAPLDSYVMDIVILNNGSARFIEPNVFGAEYAAGSSLFGWIQDKSKLYGHDPLAPLYVRFTM